MHLSDVDLCEEFLSAYNNKGRSESFYWADPFFTHIREENMQLFSPFFGQWLAFCYSKIIPFVQAHKSFPLLQIPFLSCLSAIKCLDSDILSSSQRLQVLKSALMDSEGKFDIGRMNSCISACVIFSKRPLQEEAKRCILVKMQSLRDYMDAGQHHNARACVIVLLELLPYCECSFRSFARAEPVS